MQAGLTVSLSSGSESRSHPVTLNLFHGGSPVTGQWLLWAVWPTLSTLPKSYLLEFICKSKDECVKCDLAFLLINVRIYLRNSWTLANKVDVHFFAGGARCQSSSEWMTNLNLKEAYSLCGGVMQ